jgi:aminoglycoside 3-N-acetyltransferase
MAETAKIFRCLLEDFGVARDGVLVVHSAIARLSRQGFKAEDMIETFLEHMGGGNLFMPAMTWRSVTPANPTWDEIGTPSHTGVLTEIFRTRYATSRSIHPTHSMAGWGPDAARLLSRHHVDWTPVSGNSPYGLMRDFDTYVLFIGVGLETCTAIHLPEETICPELYVLPSETAERYACRDRHGVVHEVWTRRHRKLNRDFPQFMPPLIAKGFLKSGKIGECPYAIVALRRLLHDVFVALLLNRSATLHKNDNVIVP